MTPKEWKRLIDTDMPPIGPITAAVRDANKNRARGDVRICTGRLYTDEEFEARRRRILAEPLP
jgi:hypothetical protein